VAVVTGLLFGLAPAWRCSRQDPAAALQQNVRGSSRGAGALGKTLVIAQVSLSLILLLGAGLFVRSFERLRSIDTGFQKQNVLEIGLNPVPRGYEKLDLNSYRRELIHRISNLPGVVSVAFSESPIPGSQDWNRDSISTLAEASINAHLMANTIRVSPNFFRTAGIALVQGRDFNDTDDEHHPRLAVVSRSLAKRLFPGGDVVGQTIRFSIMPEYQSIQTTLGYLACVTPRCRSCISALSRNKPKPVISWCAPRNLPKRWQPPRDAKSIPSATNMRCKQEQFLKSSRKIWSKSASPRCCPVSSPLSRCYSPRSASTA
jgi:hypothetical protein